MVAPLLVLVPGLLCDDSVWQPQIDGLADRARCWVAPNDGHDSLPALATELLRQAPADRFALAGHSMGGRIALEVMRQAPERVERLALLDTGWQPRPGGEAGENERRQRLALLDAAHAPGMAEVARRWLPGWSGPARTARRPTRRCRPWWSGARPNSSPHRCRPCWTAPMLPMCWQRGLPHPRAVRPG